MLFAQEGVLKIHVTDKISGDVLEFSNVVVENAGVTIRTGMTDANGILVLKNLSPGEYDVKAIYTGYPKNMVTGVVVKNNQTTDLDILLSSENVIGDVVITGYQKPLINQDIEVKTTFLYDEIRESPFRTIDDLMATVPGAVQEKEGMTPHFRGAREGSVVYIIDGQRCIGSHNIPFGAIEQMSVTLGGVSAKYGDGTGAFIEIETRSGLVNSHR